MARLRLLAVGLRAQVTGQSTPRKQITAAANPAKLLRLLRAETVTSFQTTPPLGFPGGKLFLSKIFISAPAEPQDFKGRVMLINSD